MKTLNLAPGLELPLDAITSTFAILAIRGAGKSNTAVVLAEELFAAHLPWVAIDPKGDWWGIRASGDGKSAGLSVLVFGGDHADIPLEPTAGKLMAKLVAEKRLTCVLDVSTMNKSAMRGFVADFAEELYRLNREPLHVFCEEADEYIPQQTDKGNGPRCLGNCETLIKKGRFRGIGVTLASQRSASVNKDVLTQTETLIAMRTPAPQDQDQIERWLPANSASDEIMKDLPTLGDGEAWFISQHAFKVTKRVHFRRRSTFNSGATPKVGEKVRPPALLADVDLGAIREQMAETIERAKADDPKALRAELAKLKAELAKKPAAAPKVETKRVEVPVLKDGQLATAQRLVKKVEVMLGSLDALGLALKMAVAPIGEAIRMTRAPAPVLTRTTVPMVARQLTAATPRPAAAPRASTADAGELGQGPTKVLAAIAGHPAGVTREQLTVLTGYKRSSRDTYLQKLRAAGLIADGERIVATDAGMAALGPNFEPLPTGAALLQHWRGKLPTGELACLEVAIRCFPDAVSRDAISETTQYQRSSRDTYLQKLRARQLITEPSRGQVRASELLFDGGAP